MTEAFDILFQASFWVAAIRIASPLIFATMGELICERRAFSISASRASWSPAPSQAG